MKKTIFISLAFMLAAGSLGAWTNPGPFYNPYVSSYVMAPPPNPEPVCIQCGYVPPKRQPAVMPIYNQNGQMTGALVHGVYDPTVPPPARNDDHPDWHLMPHR